MTSSSAQLDHVVILLPHEDVVNPPEWLTKHFTISPGGRHADGKTENKLILLSDGSYLELIAFTSEDARKGHWWDKPYGVVDFALTTPDEKFPELSSIKDRLAKTDTGISYQDPKAGGRLRPDGVELQWRVTFPINCNRGEAPFWCHDVTPRERRVPYTDDNTSHPSGVLGLAGVELKTSSHARLSTATAAILDSNLEQNGQYGVGVPQKVPTAKQPSIRIQSANGDGKDLSLTLVLQTTQKLPPIIQKIGGGTVSIVFEQPN
ncbi:hypothetical protein M409DRAFT_63121 [Zasmidium cellare ATCC 36951]|uniref:Glyoxalase-like domain-containing protein n=1 Tax=Zasmidium cellare ATCC 36951 TaxID=1080233 RepID=A0A6A6D2N2_ZASCE|nr:uncharacterized protein M409DRAFT_63121 [Zasmidium cellare ATCC 36951]KAF2172432.1 hypothetical protein M409DRAFT_63121 [Zasmidium cellare ATCC 36951]